MKFWKIEFVIDTGYDWLQRECVVTANTEDSALKNFDDWISPKLHGENFVEDSQTKINEINVSDNSIIYQNCFKEK